MELTVISDSGVVGWFAGATRIGEIYATNIKDMVTKVLAAIDTNKIKRLNLLDHNAVRINKLKTGTAKTMGIHIGKDSLDQYNLDKFKELSLLKGHFAPEGFVHLQQCYIGINQDFLKLMAAKVGAPVYGGTGAQHAVLRINLGMYVRCEPSGVCQMDAKRP